MATEKQLKPKQVVENYEGQLIGVVKRNEYKETRVYLGEYKGHPYVEVRRWVHLTKYDGPQKGVTFHPDNAASIAALILEAVEEHESRQTPTDLSSDIRQT